MKCWILSPGENWIVDEMAKQFKQDNRDICTEDIKQADVVWAMADWCFERIPANHLLARKPVVTMLHHFVPEKFDQVAAMNFMKKDAYTTVYTAPNFRTRDFVLERKLTTKPIHVVPYWVHVETWKKTGEKMELRRKYGIPEDAFVIGSFQRDTEGHDLKSPKLEKGPDLLADYIIARFEMWKMLSGDHPQPFVVLAGWRRQYVIKRLESANVPFKYFELPSQEVVNDLYQSLDLYPVCSRYEGGPQAYGEAGVHNIHVLSRPVGMAENVLPASAIGEDFSRIIPAVPNVEHLKTPNGYRSFIEILEGACK